MSDSTTTLITALDRTNEEMSTSIERLSTDHEHNLSNCQLELVSGQQDLVQNLDQASRNILDVLEARDNRLVLNMEEIMRKQSAAASFLSHTSGIESAMATAVQLSQLVGIFLTQICEM